MIKIFGILIFIIVLAFVIKEYDACKEDTKACIKDNYQALSTNLGNLVSKF